MAAWVIRIISLWSLSTDSSGSPQTCSTLTPRTTRCVPTDRGIIGTALICATGMLARSSSFAIVAPQRLQLPQVATSKTASTPVSLSSAVISSPIFRAAVTAMPFPAVV